MSSQTKQQTKMSERAERQYRKTVEDYMYGRVDMVEKPCLVDANDVSTEISKHIRRASKNKPLTITSKGKKVATVVFAGEFTSPGLSGTWFRVQQLERPEQESYIYTEELGLSDQYNAEEAWFTVFHPKNKVAYGL